ncbi:hypothetical protein [Cyanobacterium aponinum]|nr:hypothetical protein [Cyanobacterium aponinum]
MIPKNHHKSITIAEMELIISLKKQHKTVAEIANKLGRSYNSIRCFTHYYNLPPSRWTEKENEILRANYFHTPAKLLAKRLNRSLRSVYVQANKLGLRKNRIKYEL